MSGAPQPGQVIRYAYLWRREKEQGREEGSKDRPCAVVLCLEPDELGTQVFVAPITHSAPVNAADAVEIPIGTKVRLGLDQEPSWIVTTEVNVFFWPGPDIRSIPGKPDGVFGMLPPALFDSVRDKILARIVQEQGAAVVRTV